MVDAGVLDQRQENASDVEQPEEQQWDAGDQPGPALAPSVEAQAADDADDREREADDRRRAERGEERPNSARVGAQHPYQRRVVARSDLEGGVRRGQFGCLRL